MALLTSSKSQNIERSMPMMLDTQDDTKVPEVASQVVHTRDSPEPVTDRVTRSVDNPNAKLPMERPYYCYTVEHPYFENASNTFDPCFAYLAEALPRTTLSVVSAKDSALSSSIRALIPIRELLFDTYPRTFV
jgi:hypothetical protein